ncbi:hypothetical protein BLS_008497 [Venturia inaequalis]|uniref:Transglycosylase SLT domain-containing protein n=1 Tax=Venturia inaequalis TaxID=5025 RepID=A0A8H3UQM0_VENIN|nr:hypothetical protein BLS_008497 [Venturia inaequalis]KAE9973566.1 hypothetical protein EG327_009034 [Venturia inaequalis]RDI76874.1 ATP-dependent RNA helicase [Venturia inaequalis]
MHLSTVALAATTIATTAAAPLLNTTFPLNTTSPLNNTSPLNTTTPLTQRSPNAACTGQTQKREYPNPGPSERYQQIYPPTNWPSFDCLFEMNRASINAKNPNPAEADQVKAAILYAHSQTAVDARVILAVLMQESHGELRVGLTIQPDDHVSTNNGMMQCWGCKGAANVPTGQGVEQALVNEMVLGGATHLKNNLEQNGWDTFKGLRAYNSGRIDWDLNNPIAATRDYVWDCANRLVGWVW